MLFNMYRNDRPRENVTKHFLYADDLTVVAIEYSFEEIEIKIQGILNKLSTYYDPVVDFQYFSGEERS